MKVKDLVKLQVEYANTQLARPSDSFDNPSSECEYKSGVIAMVERLLFEANSYNGYTYNDSNDCEFGTTGYFSRKYYSLK